MTELPCPKGSVAAVKFSCYKDCYSIHQCIEMTEVYAFNEGGSNNGQNKTSGSGITSHSLEQLLCPNPQDISVIASVPIGQSLLPPVALFDAPLQVIYLTSSGEMSSGDIFTHPSLQHAHHRKSCVASLSRLTSHLVTFNH